MKEVLGRSRSENSGLLLSKLKKGQKGEVMKVYTQNREILKKIMAMGVFPGVQICVIQKFPSYVFQLGNSQFAIDKNIAQQIEVQVFK